MNYYLAALPIVVAIAFVVTVAILTKPRRWNHSPTIFLEVVNIFISRADVGFRFGLYYGRRTRRVQKQWETVPSYARDLENVMREQSWRAWLGFRIGYRGKP